MEHLSLSCWFKRCFQLDFSLPHFQMALQHDVLILKTICPTSGLSSIFNHFKAARLVWFKWDSVEWRVGELPFGSCFVTTPVSRGGAKIKSDFKMVQSRYRPCSISSSLSASLSFLSQSELLQHD